MPSSGTCGGGADTALARQDFSPCHLRTVALRRPVGGPPLSRAVIIIIIIIIISIIIIVSRRRWLKIVSLIGRAGSGKTLCAIAAGLQQTIGLRSENNHYSRLIVSRPVQPLGKDIGFLPGTMEEKMLPWLMPIQDNLKFLMGDRTSLEMYMEKGKIEIEALTYIRGRSIANAFIVIDEAQNLTKHEIKTIITRIGEGTKIVLTGDIEQIDNVYVNETSNGLAHAVESFKNYHISGHVTFKKGERSELATLASKVL